MPANDLTLKDALKIFVEDSKKFKRRLYQAKIKAHWTKTMGTSIVNYTTEIKIYRKKLFISISSAPLRQELSYGKDKILEMMNEMLGETFLEEVVVR
ncbi:MAG: DUF721 domain-containing protein [Bacteroidota bacterium]